MENKDIEMNSSGKTEFEELLALIEHGKENFDIEENDSSLENDSLLEDDIPDSNTDSTDGETEEKEDDEEEIVFAAVETKPKTEQKAPQKAFTMPDLPYKRMAVAGGVVAAVVLLVVIVSSAFQNQPAVETNTDPEEETSISHLIAPTGDTAYELKNINTSSITFGSNVTVNGVDLRGKTLSQAFDAVQDKIKEIRDPVNITINCDKKSLVLTEDDFKFNTDASDVLIQAYHFSRGELDTPTVVTEKKGNVTDFRITSTIDSDSIGTAVKKASKEFDIQPQDARVTKFDPDSEEKFTFADGNDGYLIDQVALKNTIREILALDDKTDNISIKTVKTPYTKTLKEVKANTRLIASHRTTVNNRWESNANMELAVRAASGTIVKPGETFSFNEMTGDTTVGDEHHYKNGTVGSYVKSTAILRGEHVDQYGGGICQASTTIYNCALKADMEILERHAHQYPSFYAEFGLDATVDYGNLDMRFKNNKDYPIYIATYVYDSNGDGLNELNVEMYGQVSAEYDEIVPVGWVTSAGPETYSAMGAKVYIKDGKEINRVFLPEGSYDYYSDGFYDVTSQGYAESLVADDPANGPAAKPTYESPSVYSPYGAGDFGPIEYGTAAEYLKEALS